jgi:hypothetical protein
MAAVVRVLLLVVVGLALWGNAGRIAAALTRRAAATPAG